MYCLKRDDGAEFRLDSGIWEVVLELAYVYGWRPAGTESPRTSAWRSRRGASDGLAWDARDYFSHESQRVARVDASALAQALQRAVQQIPDRLLPDDDGRGAVDTGSPATFPSRASVVAEGLSVRRKRSLHRFAVFARSGGFTIDGSE